MAADHGKRSDVWTQESQSSDSSSAGYSAAKRVVQVNVKMSEEDYALFHNAARVLWPGAILSNSGIVLGLAKLGVKKKVRT